MFGLYRLPASPLDTSTVTMGGFSPPIVIWIVSLFTTSHVRTSDTRIQASAQLPQQIKKTLNTILVSMLELQKMYSLAVYRLKYTA
jgi:hypothetical protein